MRAGCFRAKRRSSAIAHLEHADRQALHKLRVRLGPLDVFLPPLLKPSAQYWRAALLAVRQGQPMPKLPAAGAATLARDADPRGAALAYRRAGRTWVRIDLADRLASHARKVRSSGGTDPLDTALATSIGLDEDFDQPVDERYRLRARRGCVALARPSRPPPGPPRPGQPRFR